MSTPPVFAFNDPIEFLNFHLMENKRKTPDFSIRNWARRVGYKNPSLLFQVLKKERTLRLELAAKLAADLRMKARERRYFELLVLRNLCKTEDERAQVQKNLENIRPAQFRVARPLSLAVFSAAADWYHWAILVLVTHPRFVEEGDFIFENLGRRVDRREIRKAIERLIQVGLLKRNERGKLQRQNEEQSLFMRNQIPSEAIRRYHSQMATLAKDSIEKQTIDERYLRGTTFLLSPENAEKARAIVRHAHEELLRLQAAPQETSEAYHLQSILFRVSNINSRFVEESKTSSESEIRGEKKHDVH